MISRSWSKCIVRRDSIHLYDHQQALEKQLGPLRPFFALSSQAEADHRWLIFPLTNEGSFAAAGGSGVRCDLQS